MAPYVCTEIALIRYERIVAQALFCGVYFPLTCGCSSVVERHVANVNVGRSNRLTRFDESALPDPGGAFSWAEGEPWFTPDSHPDASDRTVSCTEVVAVLVTPCDLPVRDCQQPLEARGQSETKPSHRRM